MFQFSPVVKEMSEFLFLVKSINNRQKFLFKNKRNIIYCGK